MSFNRGFKAQGAKYQSRSANDQVDHQNGYFSNVTSNNRNKKHNTHTNTQNAQNLQNVPVNGPHTCPTCSGGVTYGWNGS